MVQGGTECDQGAAVMADHAEPVVAKLVHQGDYRGGGGALGVALE
jgi:hypothetical protein